MQRNEGDIRVELKMVRTLKAIKSTVNLISDKEIEDIEQKLTSELFMRDVPMTNEDNNTTG